VRTLFDAAGLHVTDEWVQAGGNRYPIGEIDRVWAARPPRRRPRTLALVLLIAAGVAAVAGLTALVIHNWVLVVVGAPIVVVFILFGGPLDLVTHRLENRPHELLISTRGRVRPVLSDNSVEVNKALRAVMRALEYHHDARRR